MAASRHARVGTMGGIDVEEGGGLVASAEGLQFRDLHPDDVPELMQLQSALFPVQYRKSFYDKLFAYGHYCLVGVTADGLIAAVASARVVEYDNSGNPANNGGYTVVAGGPGPANNGYGAYQAPNNQDFGNGGYY